MEFLGQEPIEKIEDILSGHLIESGVNTAAVIDLAGHIIANCNRDDCDVDIFPLAALAAGNYGAVDEMARLVGEDEFSLLFHRGKEKNLHFCKINPDLLLMTTFDSDLQLGILRLKIKESVCKIRECWTA